MIFHAQSPQIVGHVPELSEDMSPVHDVLRNKGNFLYRIGQKNPKSAVFHLRGAEGPMGTSLLLTQESTGSPG